MRNKKLALAALFLALALIIGVIESLIPPIFPFLPYIRIGFSNIVVFSAIILLNLKYGLIISVLKSVLVPLFLGNPVMIAYSLPSSVVSLCVSVLLLYSKKISIPLCSIVSSVVHNLVQLCVAAAFTGHLVFGYTPYFILIAVPCGLATGIITYFVVKYFPKRINL